MPPKEKETHQELLVFGFDHDAITANTTIKLWSPNRRFRIDRVWYVNPTGLVADAVNFFDIRILNDAAVAFNHSTETGQEGTIAADTGIELVEGAEPNAVVAAGDDISLDFVEGGVQTLPAGRLVVEGRYVF